MSVDRPAARWPLPVEQIERGRDTVIRLRLYRNGAPVAVSSATVSVYDTSETALISAAAATITDGEASYTVLAATTSGLSLGTGWRVVWTDDAGRTYDTPAALVRRVLYPTVTDVDVRRRWGYLDSGTRGAMTSAATWQPKIDDAWEQLQRRLLNQNKYPWRVLDPAAMHEPHLLLSGALIHEELAARGNPVMADTARTIRHAFEAEWARVPVQYDDDEDGRRDSRDKLAAAQHVWLGGGRRFDGWPRR
jgi:hypothetical protein